MKTQGFQRRFYRDWIMAKGLYRAHIAERETDVEIVTDKPADEEFVKEKIRAYRWDIENYILKDKKFLSSLKPISVELNAPAIIQRMSEAARKANVGPMAAVAGCVAEFLGRDLLRFGYKDVIVENGGDIFLKVRRSCNVGIYSGKSKHWRSLRLRIKPKATPLGICTSSGTLGHSLSFGLADSVAIFSKNASLADAVATATCNRVQGPRDLQNALNFARSIRGICGAVIIYKKNLISWGQVEFI